MPLFYRGFAAIFVVVFVLRSPGAERAVISNCCNGSGTILEINAANFEIERSISTGVYSVNEFSNSYAFALTPDGQGAVVESGTSSGIVLTLVDLKSGSASAALVVTGSFCGGVDPLAVNPRTGMIYAGYAEDSNASYIQEIDPSTLTLVANVFVGNFGCFGIVVSPDGERPYVDADPITVLRSADLTMVGTFPWCAGPVALSPDSGTIYQVGACEEIRSSMPSRVSGTIGKQVQLPESVGPTGVLAISPDGSTLYLLLLYNPSDTADGTLLTIDTATMSVTNSTDLDLFGFLSVTPDGKYIYSSIYDVGVAIVSSSSLQIVGTIPTNVNADGVVFAEIDAESN